MKKIFITLFMIFMLMAFAACASKEEIADELIKYYNEQWIPIQVMKQNEMSDFQDKLIEMHVEQGDEVEEEVITLLNVEAIPAADKVLAKLDAVQLEHRKIKKLHNNKIEAEELGRDLFNILIAHYRGEISKDELREKENESRNKYDEVNDYLEKLMEKYNLEYDYEKGSIEGYYEIKRVED